MLLVTTAYLRRPQPTAYTVVDGANFKATTSSAASLDCV